MPSAHITATRHRLELAGEPLSEIEFIGLQGVAALISATVAALLFLGVISATPIQTVLGTLLGALLGYIAPGLVVDSLAPARRQAIRRALVPSFDMLALTVDAGLAFDAPRSHGLQHC